MRKGISLFVSRRLGPTAPSLAVGRYPDAYCVASLGEDSGPRKLEDRQQLRHFSL
jgi:hypothetical protein